MHDLRFLGAGRYEPHTEAGGGVALPPRSLWGTIAVLFKRREPIGLS